MFDEPLISACNLAGNIVSGCQSAEDINSTLFTSQLAANADMVGGGSGPTPSGEHNDLTGRDDEDCHPITAITGLTTSLNDKEPLLPATPDEPENKFLNGNRQWAAIPTPEQPEHNDLDGRDAENAHPISAISLLQDELDNKADTDSLATVATSGSYNDLSDTPTPSDKRTEWVSLALMYQGFAPIGSLESDAVWTIYKIVTLTTGGVVSNTEPWNSHGIN